MLKPYVFGPRTFDFPVGRSLFENYDLTTEERAALDDLCQLTLKYGPTPEESLRFDEIRCIWSAMLTTIKVRQKC